MRIRDPNQQVHIYRTGEHLSQLVQVNGPHRRNPNTEDYGHINMIDDSGDTQVLRDNLE